MKELYETEDVHQDTRLQNVAGLDSEQKFRKRHQQT